MFSLVFVFRSLTSINTDIHIRQCFIATKMKQHWRPTIEQIQYYNVQNYHSLYLFNYTINQNCAFTPHLLSEQLLLNIFVQLQKAMIVVVVSSGVVVETRNMGMWFH